MPIPLTCATCGSKIKAPDNAAGRRVKCPKCGELLAVPTASQEAVLVDEPLPVVPVEPRRTAQAAPAAPTPARRRGIPVVVWLLGIPAGLFALCCGGCVMTVWMGSSAAQSALKEADKQWAEGKKDEAVATYKDKFDLSRDKAEVLRRVVEYELQKGHAAEAKAWVERGVKGGVEVTYDTPAARALLAQAKQEKDAQAAQAKADAEAKAQARQQEREKQAKAKSDEEEASVIKVTAADLYEEYKTNEVAADLRYKGKLVEVSGVVRSIDKGPFGGLYVILEAGDLFSGVTCDFDKDQTRNLAMLAPKKNAGVRGRCSGKTLGSVFLKRCRLTSYEP